MKHAERSFKYEFVWHLGFRLFNQFLITAISSKFVATYFVSFFDIYLNPSILVSLVGIVLVILQQIFEIA